MSRTEKHAKVEGVENLPTGPRGDETVRWGLHSAVDEIIESVLDAADEEILEDLAQDWGSREPGIELLHELMLDVMGRYYARQRQSATPPEVASAGEGS